MMTTTGPRLEDGAGTRTMCTTMNGRAAGAASMNETMMITMTTTRRGDDGEQ